MYSGDVNLTLAFFLTLSCKRTDVYNYREKYFGREGSNHAILALNNDDILALNNDDFSQEVSVWIVGSSLIRNAFVHARSRTGGVNLGLHRIGVKIWWQGYGGMGIKDLESTIKRLMKYEKVPKYLVLHIAGNDLGKTKLGFLRNEIKTTLEKVQSYLPNSSIVWSQILPRTNWRHSISQDSMMACRIRINSAIASFVLKNGGHYIKYPDILPNSTFLKEDGVHLTDLGNDIFLNNLQGALEMFICSGSYTYPDTFGTSMCIS
ncbi:uncharacterized protein [Mytilus edulis]|uniref:uncharacterized protein n=1 Tax=Mytilus edulis TaxID=6550 RepID=UPI0039EE72EA